MLNAVEGETTIFVRKLACEAAQNHEYSWKVRFFGVCFFQKEPCHCIKGNWRDIEAHRRQAPLLIGAPPQVADQFRTRQSRHSRSEDTA